MLSVLSWPVLVKISPATLWILTVTDRHKVVSFLKRYPELFWGKPGTLNDENKIGVLTLDSLQIS